jgi:hypothetical protein
VIFVPDGELGVRLCSVGAGETYLNSTTTFSDPRQLLDQRPGDGIPAPLRKLLKQKRTLSLRVTAEAIDPSGHSATIELPVKPKLEAKKKKKK